MCLTIFSDIKGYFESSVFEISRVYYFRSSERSISSRWLVVLVKRPFETVFQSISGRLPERGRKKERNDR